MSTGIRNSRVHFVYHHHLDTYFKRMRSLDCAKVCNCSVGLSLMQTESRTVIDFWFTFLPLKTSSTVSSQKQTPTSNDMSLFIFHFLGMESPSIN